MNDWYSSSHVRKSSRSTTVRYVRNWTPDEDAHLVLQRTKRVPYKQIALELHKTELACRLHYYQILSATRRESTGGQHGPNSCEPGLETKAQRRLRLGLYHNSEVEHMGMITSPWSKSTITRSTLSLPPLTKPLSSSVQHQYNSSYQGLDVARLQQIYAQHKDAFWRGIAASYSQGVSIPINEMEAAVFMFSVPSSTTPCSSTSTSPSASSTTSNDQDSELHCPKPNRCAVSSLLNS